jgi:hypothetical protein
MFCFTQALRNIVLRGATSTIAKHAMQNIGLSMFQRSKENPKA